MSPASAGHFATRRAMINGLAIGQWGATTTLEGHGPAVGQRAGREGPRHHRRGSGWLPDPSAHLVSGVRAIRDKYNLMGGPTSFLIPAQGQRADQPGQHRQALGIPRRQHLLCDHDWLPGPEQTKDICFLPVGCRRSSMHRAESPSSGVGGSNDAVGREHRAVLVARYRRNQNPKSSMTSSPAPAVPSGLLPLRRESSRS